MIRKTLICSMMTLAAIAATNSPALAGARPSAVSHIDCVLPFDTDTYRILLRGGERAYIEVIGDGDTDLDMFVYDEEGYLVGSDTDSTDHCLVVLSPRWSSEFRVEVRNFGRVYNCYRLRTN